MPSYKISKVFRSRWNAAFWSLSVLLTAYCSVPAPETDSKTSAKDQEAAERLVARLTNHKLAEHHVNPWDTPGK